MAFKSMYCTMNITKIKQYQFWQCKQHSQDDKVDSTKGDTINAEESQTRAASYFHKPNETGVINETYFWVMAFYCWAEKQTKLNSLLMFPSANNPDLSSLVLTRAYMRFSFPLFM